MYETGHDLLLCLADFFRVGTRACSPVEMAAASSGDSPITRRSSPLMPFDVPALGSFLTQQVRHVISST